MYNLMYNLFKIAVSRILAKIIAKSFCPWPAGQGQKDFAIILAKIRDTAILNRLYIKLYIKFVANNGKNRDSVHAAISFCPWLPQRLAPNRCSPELFF